MSKTPTETHVAILAAGALLMLALVLVGCTQPGEIGYTGENYSQYHQLNETVRLVNKTRCFFGETPFLIKTEDNASCAYLREGHFYNIQGMIVRRERLESPQMNALLRTIGTGDDRIVSNREMYVIMPVIALDSAREVRYQDVFLEQKIWVEPVGKQVDLTCENVVNRQDDSNGTVASVSMKTTRIQTVSVRDAMLGRTRVLNSTIYPFIVEVEHPAGMRAGGANLTLSQAAPVVGYGETVGDTTYFEFDLPNPISQADVKEIRIGLGDLQSGGYEDCQGQINGLSGSS
ncbi:MAG: hypothetical protein V1728_04825 [Candidatus Micrarchaeota archaeon]